MNSIEIPSEVQRDSNAKELARLWAANNKLNVAISVGIFANNGKDEAACWGVVLSDFTRHVARALCQQYGANQEQIMAQIADTYFKELGAPTSGIQGR
ncbi:MAG TPA: DUF5076 domain-containing protein [Candidatus Eisenbacteria bacterium]|nr:DUF5076 domain-containing protein [Candidatus Eisenbacteria bacterium]